ncbi:DeoR/GlpR family DNA-binding transcription regulator [Paenibacillus sp. P96]|uniref:DeoR/GlpR family DNA-binding transcription regulator n=1 Tax=Paenibacillus zeirhizosphaerae TaxID=2987519 RepID=A0ABT9FTC6_9BACL|nr:DeoR/GlpR family DNA-binding transcription regulator [Paenibacillus sp. P96]MDP4097929.1 DeoR/GlpR family DNA-binding transcription regulator [Paenibacillus sp. P96]
MDQLQRLSQIVEMTNTMALVTVQDICDTFQVSRDTARRDLVKLEEQGKITRTRGGAVSATIQTYVQRKEENGVTKRKLAKAAASYVQNGDVLFMDSSTSVAALAEFLIEKSLTVVTHSLHIAQCFGNLPRTEIIIPGGRFNPEEQFVYGTDALAALDRFRANCFFTGACGLDDGEITAANLEDALIKQKMMSRARQVFLLADHTKINVNYPYKVGHLEEIDILFTDREISPRLHVSARPKHIQVVGAP